MLLEAPEMLFLMRCDLNNDFRKRHILKFELLTIVPASACYAATGGSEGGERDRYCRLYLMEVCTIARSPVWSCMEMRDTNTQRVVTSGIFQTRQDAVIRWD